MKVGITLPQFADDAGPALAAAARAEALGLDGVFCFDHLWPMGRPGRPALSAWPLLGALVTSTRTLTIGSLVARIGLLPDRLLESAAHTLAALSGGRFLAGIGTGDHQSAPENRAFGVPYEHAALRRRRLGQVAARLAGSGIAVWVGGGAPPTLEVARAHGLTVNLWGAPASRVAQLRAGGLGVSWGGELEGESAAMAEQLAALAAAGAAWAVVAAPVSLDALAEAARTVQET
ncbi:MAG: LLM class flavin-dependent oxidoreductase [Acidimicrobiales bacterium]|nr:LLM class flavin-dependent oxidoreductase [Acidimicrobiales bacterium]